MKMDQVASSQNDEQKRAAKPATPRCAGAQRPHTQHQALRSGQVHNDPGDADVEQWQKEVLANEPKTLGKR